MVDDESRQKAHQDPKKILQDKRRRLKEERLKEKYISRCKHFLESYDRLEYCIKSALSSNGIDELLSICYIFGTSPISPKEIYRVRFPKGNPETLGHSILWTYGFLL